MKQSIVLAVLLQASAFVRSELIELPANLEQSQRDLPEMVRFESHCIPKGLLGAHLF